MTNREARRWHQVTVLCGDVVGAKIEWDASTDECPIRPPVITLAIEKSDGSQGVNCYMTHKQAEELSGVLKGLVEYFE